MSLDVADDTDNSASDFALGTGNPRGNSVSPTETPCPASTPTTSSSAKKKCKKEEKAALS